MIRKTVIGLLTALNALSVSTESNETKLFSCIYSEINSDMVLFRFNLADVSNRSIRINILSMETWKQRTPRRDDNSKLDLFESVHV